MFAHVHVPGASRTINSGWDRHRIKAFIALTDQADAATNQGLSNESWTKPPDSALYQK